MAEGHLTLQGLIDWLAKQPGETEYNFVDPQDCLLHRFLRAIGLPVARVEPALWVDRDGRQNQLPSGLRAVSQGFARHLDWTYAAALERAEWLAAAGVK